MDTSDDANETRPKFDTASTTSPEAGRVPIAQLAENYLKLGLFSGKAQKVFGEAAAICPDNPEWQKALNICLQLQAVRERIHKQTDGRAAPAFAGSQRQTIEELFEEYPCSPDLAKCLGDVRLLDGDWEGAHEAYRKARTNGYHDDQAIVNGGPIAVRDATCPPSLLVYFGELALALGQLPQAAEFLTEALRRSTDQRELSLTILDLVSDRLLSRLDHPELKQALLTEVARACLEFGQMERALDAFRQLDLTRFPHSNWIKQIARYLIDQEDYRQAFDFLSRIPFDNDTKNLVNEITLQLEKRGEVDTVVYLLQYMNEHDLVIQEGQRLVQSRLESAATREMAERCLRSKRYDEAFSHFVILLRRGTAKSADLANQIETAALNAAHPKIEDLLLLGEYFYERREYHPAECFLARILDLEPGHARACQLLRLICDILLKDDPSRVQIRLRSGDLYLLANRVEDAIAEYKKALEAPEGGLPARRRLSAAYLRCGESSLALQQYRDLPLTTADLEVLYDIHENLMKASLFQEALQAATLIYEFDNRYRDVEGRIAQLRQSVRQPETPQPFCDPKMVELIGDQAIGRYRYIEQIGSGGMGIVHKVYDLKNQCVVAMKILRESLTSSSRAIDRFFREARIAATFSHPNIVNIFDYNINPVYGKSYISMEYVDGPSLRDLIEEHFSATGELSAEYIAEILYYSCQLCSALETTHMKGIIHRDIKPDNIMITSEKIVKITDFGIVHIEEATFTPTGALIGTPRYMSPEQVRGGRVDSRSDIYAVGIIIYEALLGTPPFISGDIAYQHVNVAPAAPREINPSIPAEVSALIMKCLEKDPPNRYQGAKELNGAITSVMRTVYPKYCAHFFDGPPASTVEASSTSL